MERWLKFRTRLLQVQWSQNRSTRASDTPKLGTQSVWKRLNLYAHRCRSFSLCSPLITTHADLVIENLDCTDNGDAYVNRMTSVDEATFYLPIYENSKNVCICGSEDSFILRARFEESEIQRVSL
jgi:hypothetical protein